MFITFEGGEGAGKTTQIALLKDYFGRMGREVILTREPGGTPEAEKIRALLVQRDGGHWTPTAETLLFFTGRHMHWVDKIKPALDAGKIVISDRFTDSTIAYQGYGHGFDMRVLQAVKDIAIGDVEPDMTFILDIPVRKGLERSSRRLTDLHEQNAGADEKTIEDRFERMDLSFHERLRQGFLTIAQNNPGRCIVIDAMQPAETIHAAVLSHLEGRMTG